MFTDLLFLQTHSNLMASIYQASTGLDKIYVCPAHICKYLDPDIYKDCFCELYKLIFFERWWMSTNKSSLTVMHRMNNTRQIQCQSALGNASIQSYQIMKRSLNEAFTDHEWLSREKKLIVGSSISLSE